MMTHTSTGPHQGEWKVALGHFMKERDRCIKESPSSQRRPIELQWELRKGVLTVTFVKLSPPSASSREHLETSTNNSIHWTWESKMTVWPWIALVPAAGRRI
jgi:hypothetical protein